MMSRIDDMRCSIPEGVSGDWKVEQFEVDEGDAAMSAILAVCSSGGRGRSVPEGTYTALKINGSIMMSDTPDELRDHFTPLYEARGVCLVTGLGLGCVVQGMLEKRDKEGNLSVEKAIVIENSEDVIKLVGTYMKERYGGRLEIRHEDALTYKAPRGEKYDVVWHDIWISICEDNLDEMATLHRKYGRRCDWQESWQRHELKRLRAHSKRQRRAYEWW